MSKTRKCPRYAFRSVTESVIPATGDWWACFGAIALEELVVWPIVGWAIQRHEQTPFDDARYRHEIWEESDYPQRDCMPIVATPHDPLPWSAEDIGEFMESEATTFAFLGCYRGEMPPGFRDAALDRMRLKVDQIKREIEADTLNPSQT